MLRHITRVIAASERCEDLVFVREHELGLWVVVLDGAGGMSGGLRAVELAAALLGTVPSAPSPATLVTLLSEVDDALDRDRGAGETTAVVAWVSANPIVGASAGDSSLLLVSDTGEQDFTANQHQKRRLGSGRAIPIGFSAAPSPPFRILAGTDGLFRHAPHGHLVSAARDPALDSAASRLLELPRLKSGGYADDVGFVLMAVPGGWSGALQSAKR